MRLLLVTEFFPENKKLNFTGGVESFNFYLVENLSKKNQVTVLCRKQSHGKTDTDWKYKVIRVGSVSDRIDASVQTIPSRLSFFVEGIREGIKQDFDVVQGNNFVTYIQAFVIGFIKRKPTVAWYPDVFIGRWLRLVGGITGLFGEVTERFSLILPWTAFVAMSKETKKRLIRAGVEEGKVQVIYAGIDKSDFKKVKSKKAKEFTICSMARLVSYKRIDLLIKAANILRHQGLKFNIAILGSGPEKEKLQKLITSMKLNGSVKIYSNLSIDKRSELLKSSQLFCLPSEIEGFGIVTIEAAACGVPFVLTDIPIFREVTREGLGGVFFKKGDEEDLAKKIASILLNKSLRKKLSKDASKLADFYKWSIITREFENFYARLLNKKTTENPNAC